jgi:hypothetical protein
VAASNQNATCPIATPDLAARGRGKMIDEVHLFVAPISTGVAPVCGDVLGNRDSPVRG